MIISLDTETQGLNTQKFVMGVIIKENKKAEHFNNRHKMWERIHELAEQDKRRGKTLFVYAHNMQYDYYVISHGENPKNHYLYCPEPYIVDIKDEKGKIYCKFLSTTALWKGALKEIGEALGRPKGETPEWLKKDYHNPTEDELREAHKYMEQDEDKETDIEDSGWIEKMSKRLSGKSKPKEPPENDH